MSERDGVRSRIPPRAASASRPAVRANRFSSYLRRLLGAGGFMHGIAILNMLGLGLPFEQ